jgi:hypothetical protein
MRNAETVLGIIHNRFAVLEDTGEPGAPKGCAVKTAGRILIQDERSREKCFWVNHLTGW